MTPFETYQTYLALKSHFTSNYDFYKYNGKVSASETAFRKRKDSLFFGKVGLHDNPFEFLLCHVSNNPKVYIRDIAYKKSAQLEYEDWKKRFDNPLFFYEQELKELVPKWKRVKKGQHPFALKAYLTGDLSLNSFCMFMSFDQTLEKYNDVLSNDIIWHDIKQLVTNYRPFLKYDQNKVNQITREVFCGIGYL
jgi:hypothetical protein